MDFAFLRGQKLASAHLWRSWRSNCWHQFYSRGTPEHFAVQRFKWAMWKVNGIKIETASGHRIISPKGQKKSWKSDIFYFTVPYPKFFIFFWGEVPPESLGTHNSEYLYKMGVTHIFDRVILTQSRVMLKQELPTKLRQCSNKQDHLTMNVALDQTIILGVRSLGSIDKSLDDSVSPLTIHILNPQDMWIHKVPRNLCHPSWQIP